MIGDLIAAGTTSGTATLNPTSRTSGWFVMATTATQVTVQFDNGPTITLPALLNFWTQIDGDYQSITVTGGTVAYYVVG